MNLIKLIGTKEIMLNLLASPLTVVSPQHSETPRQGDVKPSRLASIKQSHLISGFISYANAGRGNHHK